MDRLKLTLLDEKGPVGGKDGSRILSNQSISIGREPGNDWILQDNTRQLSRQHCVVSCVQDDYHLTDTSTNGVFLNGSREPLGKGSSTKLRPGDKFQLGQYSILVSATNDAGETATAGSTDGATTVEEGFEDDDPFRLSSHVVTQEPLSRNQKPKLSAEKAARGSDSFIAGFDPAKSFDTKFDIAKALGDLEESTVTPKQLPPSEDDLEEFLLPLPGEDAAEPTDTESDNLSKYEYDTNRVVEPDASTSADFAKGDDDARPVVDRSVSLQHKDALVMAFAGAAGISLPEDLSPEDQRNLMVRAGEVMFELLDGFRGILNDRSTMKKEFRLERTVLQFGNNNPIKFATSTTQSIEAVLVKVQAGYQDGPTAIRECVADIKAHHLATMAGMQCALEALLADFDPIALQSKIEDKSLLSDFVAGGRRARYWRAYQETYEDIRKDAENMFESRFEREFAAAYERNVRPEDP